VYYTGVMSRTVLSIRLEDELVAKVDAYARDHGWLAFQKATAVRAKPSDTGRTALIENLLEALVEGRIQVLPRAGKNAFPQEEVPAGETAENPVLIHFTR
jgi:predicted transcriptional regulator